MSKGSERVTIRLPKGMRELIETELAKRNRKQANDRPWTLTEWMLNAVVDKLNHCHRSRSQQTQFTVDKPDDNLPAIFGVVSPGE